MNRKIYFFIIPLVLVLASFLLEPRCTHGLCLFSGKGIPLGYYYKEKFFLDAFVADYVFFFLVYAMIVLPIQDIRRWLRRRGNENQRT